MFINTTTAILCLVAILFIYLQEQRRCVLSKKLGEILPTNNIADMHAITTPIFHLIRIALSLTNIIQKVSTHSYATEIILYHLDNMENLLMLWDLQ